MTEAAKNMFKGVPISVALSLLVLAAGVVTGFTKVQSDTAHNAARISEIAVKVELIEGRLRSVETDAARTQRDIQHISEALSTIDGKLDRLLGNG